MPARQPLGKTTKPSRKVQWEPDFIPWGVGIGMMIALAAEVYWHGNVLWMASGGLVGAAVGVICDTALTGEQWTVIIAPARMPPPSPVNAAAAVTPDRLNL